MIRSGFVSNSSSSSFVIIGFKTSNKELMELLNITDDEDLYNTIAYSEEYAEYDYMYEQEIFGYILVRSADDEIFPEESFSLEDILEIATKLKNKFKKPITEIKVFTGTD